MYYHSCPLKYVEYGKIVPYKDDDNWLRPCYEWLGHYCGYSPQVWLSRSNSRLTGFRSSNIRKKRKRVDIGKRKQKKVHLDSVLFGFENIKGFPVEYSLWSFILHYLINIESKDVKHINKELMKRFDQSVKWAKEEGYLEDDERLKAWDKNKNRDFDTFLKENLFVENDQVVVPSLNLKSAKKIICQNEKQKKKLRKMGFIEDRIHIKNLKKWDY